LSTGKYEILQYIWRSVFSKAFLSDKYTIHILSQSVKMEFLRKTLQFLSNISLGRLAKSGAA